MNLGFPIFPIQPEFYRRVVTKINGLALGHVAATDNAVPSVPTTGTWARGDVVRNSLPSVLGVAGSQYVVSGWIRITDGSNNVLNTDWVAMRSLTGT
jgi:hypothetical protein